MASTTVINIRHPEKLSWALSNGVFVAIHRPSKWGNPFSHKEGTLAQWKVSSRAEAIERVSAWFLTQPDLLAALPELKGKVLGCFCAPLACHGNVLAKYADHGVPVQTQISLF
jgi:hypothetical protein